MKLTPSQAKRIEEAQQAVDLALAAPELLTAINYILDFLDSLPKGWLAKTSGDIGAFNDFYCSAPVRKLTAERKGA